jgi:hypothetical protein
MDSPFQISGTAMLHPTHAVRQQAKKKPAEAGFGAAKSLIYKAFAA